MYTPVNEAIAELERRQSDKELEKKVANFLNGDIPASLNNTKRNAVLFRNVFTPDYELEVFESFVDTYSCVPVLLEYTDDKFVAVNEDKYALGKLYFYLGTSESTDTNMFAKKIIDFNDSEGKQIVDMKTLTGENFVAFHHRILEQFRPEMIPHIEDISEWLHVHGGNAKEYYKQFLALFIRHGILFDNFRTSGAEAGFSDHVFGPAFSLVSEHFGLAPLICSLQEPSDENNPKWWGYDKSRMSGILESIEAEIR